MTTPQLGPAHIAMRSIVEVPFDADDLTLRDDTDRRRFFAADHATVTYTQEYTEVGTMDQTITPWTITAVVTGLLITANGVPGTRRTGRTFTDNPASDQPSLPDWLGDIVERYHPAKRP